MFMKKKMLLILITLVLSLSVLFTSCVVKDNEELETKSTENIEEKTEDPLVNPPGRFPVCKEKITMTVGMPMHPNVKDYETNELTKWLKEKTNIDFVFDLYTSSEATQKLQMMIAGGAQLPEVVLGISFTNLEIASFANQGTIVPLTEYYEKYGLWTKEMLSKANNDKLKELLTAPDGNIYVIPKYAEQLGNEWSLRSWINKSWLDNLGLEMPRTTDDFYSVLKAFKTNDPNGNVSEDEIPFVGSRNGWRQQTYDFILNAFIYNDTINRYIVNDGKLDVAYNKTQWRDGLKYLNKLTSEELMSPLSFTQNNQQFKQMFGTSGPATIGVFTAGSTAAVLGATDERIAQYEPLPPLKGPDGDEWAAHFPTMPFNFFIVTKECKHPLAAFLWGDLMLSEESAMRSRWGVPGVDWLEPVAGEKGMYENMGYKAKLKPILPWGSAQNSHWNEMNPTFRTFEFADGQVWNGNILDGEYRVSMSVPLYIGKAPKEIVYDLIFTEAEVGQITEINSNLKNYVQDNIVRFSTGDRRIESEWDAYVNEFEKLGLKQYLEISQKAYDRMNQ